ncbi:MAG: putative bifunctional diguanylate cyclase/phosphodiesterase, partial [Leptothrix sp. (in: b-proteobacteria)]
GPAARHADDTPGAPNTQDAPSAAEPASATRRLRELRERVRHLLRHDLLTGVFNRREFDRRLKRALRLQQASDLDRAADVLLFINLDEFKLVNDACGHVAGDRVLRQISALIGAGLRAQDTLARLGGDEFGVILANCSSAEAQCMADAICERLDAHRHVHRHPERGVPHPQRLRIGASIGLVPITAGWPDPDVMLQAAEGACQQAKDDGRNRVATWFAHDPRRRGHDDAVGWAARIAEAIDAGGFVLHAQRITPIGAGARPNGPVHLEVLLRKRLRHIDGEYGDEVLSPGLFMPAAERFHMANRVDRWVLRETLALLARHLPALARVDLVSINLSGQSLSDPDFLAWAGAQIDASPVEPQRLCFEVTETAAITHMPEAIAFAQAMRARGVRIALDDFGAGASSYGYLRALPVDLLKIDGQYVQGLEDDALKHAAVTSFCSVARAVGVRTVAEWVETEQTLATLRTLGVDYAQGHLLHRAEPLQGLLARLVD